MCLTGEPEEVNSKTEVEAVYEHNDLKCFLGTWGKH